MDSGIFTWAMIIIVIGFGLFGLYSLIKKAIKDALREYYNEKNDGQ
jgi:hypothetical protein